MNDADSIRTAYAAQVQKLYAQLCLNYTDAADNADGERQADQSFSTGLSIARRTRDRALALVAQ